MTPQTAPLGDGLDRVLIGRVIEREMRRQPHLRTWPALERASGVSRATLGRAHRGEASTKFGTFNSIEAALRLPHDTLSTVGKHDLEGLEELRVSPDLIAWVRKELSKSAGETGSAVGG